MEIVSYIIETILFMLASIGALLIGFEMLSNNITKLFHSQLKKIFNKTSSKSIIGVLIGTIVTVIIQSSGATTVMVVGFVNTGIIDLTQAAALIIGANIGTTITAQLAALSNLNLGFLSFNFGAYALGLAGIGALISMFSKKEKVKTIGNVLAGFGILFLGLECMSLAIDKEFTGVFNGEEVTNLPLVKEAIKILLANDFISTSWFSPFILFILGIILTALVQSSSLITTVIISLSAAGIYIGAGANATSLTNNVLFLILGSNIGTCVTAMISSAGASTNAKRASVIHLLFNTIGSLIFMVFLLLWKDFMQDTFAKWFPNPETQIAMFHTFFNITCAIIFLPFIKVLVKLATIIVKDKEEEKVQSGLIFIDERLFGTPSVAVHQVRKELEYMYSKSLDILNRAIDGFINKNINIRSEVDIVNDDLESHNKLVIEFMVKLSNLDLVLEDECTISAFHRVSNDILRIGEIAENICKYTKQAVNKELSFSPNVMLNIGFMKNKINSLYERSDEVFITKNLTKLNLVDEVEDEIDKMRKELINDHMERLNTGECSPQNSGVYVNLVNNMERAADHMVYIAYSVLDANNQLKNSK